jgi:hypothetical protein
MISLIKTTRELTAGTSNTEIKKYITQGTLAIKEGNLEGAFE